MLEEKVRYAELLPHEFRRRLAEKPIAYLPLGTLEWHGEHLPLGSDAIISEALMVAAARRLGGIVLPPIYLGPDRTLLTQEQGHLQGMEFVDVSSPNRRLEGNCYWVPEGLFALLIDAILEQVRRAGFKTVFADGHGPSRASWLRYLDDRQDRFGLKLFGLAGEALAMWHSQLDHAAKNETSQMLAVRPDLVDLSRLPKDRAVWPAAVEGEDPRDSTAEYGITCIRESIQVLEKMFERARL